MNSDLFNEFTFFILAIFVGIEVISKVPTILHTPLMSGTNAIHGIILVGAILIAASANDPLHIALGLVAVVLATINVVGVASSRGAMTTMPISHCSDSGQPDVRPYSTGSGLTAHLHFRLRPDILEPGVRHPAQRFS